MLKQKTVYFREEDLPLWEAIENKAEWLHKALSGGVRDFNVPSNQPGPVIHKVEAKSVTYKPTNNWGA